MKHLFIIVFILFLAGFVFAQPQPARACRGWSSGNTCCSNYNPQSIETLSGEVLSVERVANAKGMSEGIHLLLKTDVETISVHLGPAWYLDDQDIQIGVNDRIQVKGSRIALEDKPAIIVSEVMKGEARMKLRNQNGAPEWGGCRRR